MASVIQNKRDGKWYITGVNSIGPYDDERGASSRKDVLRGKISPAAYVIQNKRDSKWYVMGIQGNVGPFDSDSQAQSILSVNQSVMHAEPSHVSFSETGRNLDSKRAGVKKSRI